MKAKEVPTSGPGKEAKGQALATEAQTCSPSEVVQGAEACRLETNLLRGLLSWTLATCKTELFLAKQRLKALPKRYSRLLTTQAYADASESGAILSRVEDPAVLLWT